MILIYVSVISLVFFINTDGKDSGFVIREGLWRPSPLLCVFVWVNAHYHVLRWGREMPLLCVWTLIQQFCLHLSPWPGPPDAPKGRK